MHSNNVFQYSRIRTRKRNAKKSIKTENIGIQPFLESGIHWAGIRNPVVRIRNPQRGIQNPRLSWIPLHGATCYLIHNKLKQLRFNCNISPFIKQKCNQYSLNGNKATLTQLLTLGRTRKFILPSWYKGRGWNPSTAEFLICWSISKLFFLEWKSFDLLKKMRYIFWVVELLEAFESLSPSWISPRLEIRLKSRWRWAFLLDMQNNTKKYFVSFHPQVLLLLLKEVGKICIFTQKRLDLLLMTSYLVNIVTDPHWTCLKIRARNKRTAAENVRRWCFMV